MARATVLILLSALTSSTFAQTWCGKHYMSSTPPVEPGGEFPIPQISNEPLLALRCAQAIKPYLPSDDLKAATVLVDASVVHSFITGATKITLPDDPSNASLDVTVTAVTPGSSNAEPITLGTGSIKLNSTKSAISISLADLEASSTAYDLTCTAKLGDQSFTSEKSQLAFLPDPADGTLVTKMDARTGALMKKSQKTGEWEGIFPIGYYTQFDSYLAKNLSVLNELKDQGFTVVHPIPPYDDQDALLAIADRMAELGLHLMYDFRGTYMDNASVTQQVNLIKNHPALLFWYTADEPDGTSDPLNATLQSHDLIMSLDGGGYHPVSLVLNCQNYFFNEYASGSEIVLQDVYTIGNNLSFSTQWNTPCTDNYGDCGCDNCHTGFEDIAMRMDQFYERLFITGRELGSSVWAVPQGFGNETYWKRFPTGEEWVLQSIIGINHGAMGVVSWDDPTSQPIKSASSTFSLALPQLNPYILSSSPSKSYKNIITNRIDVGIWSGVDDSDATKGTTMVLATNMNYEDVTVSWEELGLGDVDEAKVKQVYEGGAKLGDAGIEFGQVGSGAFIISA